MKIIKKSNFRIVVEPKGLGDFGGIRTSDSFFYPKQEDREKEYERRCKDIIEQIKRHVDSVDRVSIDYDADVTCSHCGYGWEIDEETKLPTCCEKAIEEFKEEKTTKA